METPNQFSSKWGSQEWCLDTVRTIMSNIWGSGEFRNSERIAYDLYFGHQDQNSFNYLTKVGRFQMPARVRMINIVKPYFDILESTEATRPMPFVVYGVDDNTVQERADEKARKIVDTYLSRLDQKMEQIALVREKMRKQKEEAVAQGLDQSSLSSLELQLKRIEQDATRAEALIGQDIRELERQHTLTGKTARERKINDALAYLNQKYKFRQILSDGFRDQLIVDNQIYRINDVYEGMDPTFRRCSPSNIWYQADPNCQYLDEANWIVERRFVSPEVLISEYGGKMTDEQRSEVISRIPRRQTTSIDLNRGILDGLGGNAIGCSDSVYSGTTTISYDAIEVFEIEWKTVRKIHVKKSVDKKDPSVTHTHIISSESEYKPSDERIVRYVTEYWRATCIGNNAFIDMRPCAFQHRDIKDIGTARSSYVGFAYNGYDNRPYSRVLAVRDVVLIYQLVWYQIELLQAISGMKGIVMDITQKPANMSNDEWLSMAKRGILPINPAQSEEESGRPTRFNAFATFDMTFGNAIAQLKELLPELQLLAGRILGISPQRIGEIGNRETPGSAKSAIIQSNITTEIIMMKSDRIKMRVLQRIVDIIPYAWRNGKRGVYVLGKDGQRLFDIAANEFEGMAFELFFGDGDKETKLKDQLLSIAMQSYGSDGTISLSQLASAMSMDTLSELQESLEYFETLAEQRISARGAAAEEAKAAAQERLLQLQASIQGKAGETDILKAQIQEAQLRLREQEIAANERLSMAIQAEKSRSAEKIASQDSQVELAYLQNDKERWQTEARLKQLELALDGLANVRDGLSSSRDKNKVPSK